MEELSTAQIAARVGKTERTVQRWIKSGRLPVLPLADKRYGVNPKDLEHLKLPEHLTETGEIALEVMQIRYPSEEKYEQLQYSIDEVTERLEDAEEKIERLQYRLDQILKEIRENAVNKKKAPARRVNTRKKRKRLKLGDIYLDSILPLDLVSLSAFAEQHGVPWSAVTKAIKGYELFPERGNWKDGWRTVKVAIDERGRKTFYELFHGRTGFTRCSECPHRWR
jgi:predicted site-specific integrase-resolvase